MSDKCPHTVSTGIEGHPYARCDACGANVMVDTGLIPRGDAEPLPADIEGAIDAFERAAENEGYRSAFDRNMGESDEAKANLRATIARHLAVFRAKHG